MSTFEGLEKRCLFSGSSGDSAGPITPSRLTAMALWSGTPSPTDSSGTTVTVGLPHPDARAGVSPLALVAGILIVPTQRGDVLGLNQTLKSMRDGDAKMVIVSENLDLIAQSPSSPFDALEEWQGSA